MRAAQSPPPMGDHDRNVQYRVHRPCGRAPSACERRRGREDLASSDVARAMLAVGAAGCLVQIPPEETSACGEVGCAILDFPEE